jgi:hypothetical protein
VLDLLWNIADAATFFSGNQLLECYYPWRPVVPPPRPPQEAAYVASSAFGLAQCVIAIVTWWPDHLNYYTAMRLSGRVARRLPQATSYIRWVWLSGMMVPACQVAILVKIFSDMVEHMYTGISQIAFASIELANPTSIKADATLKAGIVGWTYESDPIRVEGGLPAYRWTTLDDLPPGLSLVVDTPSVFDYGDVALLKGTPSAGGEYHFRLQSTDGYAMTPSTAEKTFSLVVYDKPHASFTVSQSRGPAPLPVRFRDTSTGGVTAWAWDLGDGNKSSEQNPVHTYGKPGSYTVTLAVTNPGGSDTSPPQVILVEAPTD